MSNLVKHAELELKMAGLLSEDFFYGSQFGEGIIEIVKLFANQGHTGMSAGIAIDVLSKLLNFKPLGPLTGSDEEWIEVSEGLFQNKRCSNVFRDKNLFNGQAYDIDAVVFEDQDGSRFTSSDSFRPIVFPYTPTTEIVKVSR